MSRADSHTDADLASPPPSKMRRTSHNPNQQLLPQDFLPLRDAIAKELEPALRNSNLAFDVATDMVRVWPAVGFSFETLKSRIKNSDGGVEGQKSLAAKLKFNLRKKFDRHPHR